LLLRGASCDDDNIALSGFGVLGSSYTGACVTMVSGVAEILNLGIAEFGFGVHEEDLAGDLVVLFGWKICY
jgi:hypothetical protein